jgi:hypothetical protein
MRPNRTTESSPERLLTSLFIKASLKYPANISGQGIWLTLLFRQGQAEGRIIQSAKLYDLKNVLSEETKDDVLELIIHAAHKAHRQLKDKPPLSPQRVEGIVSKVLNASLGCQSFSDKQLHALLEMLPIYMQVMEHVSGNGEQDAENPELLMRKMLIKQVVCRAFEGDQQEIMLWMVDRCLFSMMVSHHTYVDARFTIFFSGTL